MNWLKKNNFIILLVFIYILSEWIHYRIDFTAEKKYTLSAASKNILSQLDSDIDIRILLGDDIPSPLKKLSFAVVDLLDEMNEYTSHPIRFYNQAHYIGLDNDTLKALFYDSLKNLGLKPMNVHTQVKKSEQQEKRMVFPGIIISYKGKALGVNLLAESMINTSASLSTSEALLEYKLISAINTLVNPTPKYIAFALGNGEPFNYYTYDFIQTIYNQYLLDTFSLQHVPYIPHEKYKTLVILKPTKTFSELDKIKIDQYIMNGGNVLFLLDNLYADLSVLKQQKQMIAANYNLGLEDLLFQYGLRTNFDLIQDIQCDRLPLQVGWLGDKPQFDFLPWYFFPLLTPSQDHPITKNLEPVLGQFVNSLDTLNVANVTKTVLLTSSIGSRKIGSPALISWESLKILPEASIFNKSYIPVAYLLESNHFNSYAKYIPTSKYNMPTIIPKSASPAKIIVAMDGDIALNNVSPKEGILEMGMNPYNKYKFGNKTFIENALEYLSSDNKIIEARNKSFEIRLLNKKRIEEEQSFWQWLNIILPLVLIIIFYITFMMYRWRKYQA